MCSLTFVSCDLLSRDNVVFIRIFWVRQGFWVCEDGALGHSKLPIPALAVLKARAGLAIVARRWVVIDKFNMMARRTAACFERCRHVGDQDGSGCVRCCSMAALRWQS